MPKSRLTWYKSDAKAIWNVVKNIPRKDLVRIIGGTPQAASYRVQHMYQKQIEEMLQILDIAGYEVVEKG